MDQDRIPKIALRWTPPGKRKQGRSKNTWRRTVTAELKEMNLTWGEAQHVAQDRSRWRQIVEALCPIPCGKLFALFNHHSDRNKTLSFLCDWLRSTFFCTLWCDPGISENLVQIAREMSSHEKVKSHKINAMLVYGNIAKIRSILSTSDAEIIIHAFVTSRLDYCNVLFSGLPMSSIKRLQLVQNAAARLLTKTRKFDHITPILAHLHWLPVHLRCDFKVLLLTYKILHGLAPAYLADCIVPYVPTRNLRSKNSGLLVIPRAKKKSAGYRAFSIRAPVLWNALPVTVRDATSVEAFKSHLKTHLYNLAFK
ncbi:uncharacterized protein LOC133656987 [Entelurus aequoreus]|uniref:uncharacterized protein LOC133656987 n=1 Tax=Entelurus aequoreus TaxID=161455 RepID=UPI002B1D666D|nr:uncharacterized protein LOC133656987 [Entelurus aequoreus]